MDWWQHSIFIRPHVDCQPLIVDLGPKRSSDRFRSHAVRHTTSLRCSMIMSHLISEMTSLHPIIYIFGWKASAFGRPNIMVKAIFNKKLLSNWSSDVVAVVHWNCPSTNYESAILVQCQGLFFDHWINMQTPAFAFGETADFHTCALVWLQLAMRHWRTLPNSCSNYARCGGKMYRFNYCRSDPWDDKLSCVNWSNNLICFIPSKYLAR